MSCAPARAFSLAGGTLRVGAPADVTLFDPSLEWTVDPVTQGRWFEFKETFRYRDGSTKQVATMKKFAAFPGPFAPQRRLHRS